MPLKIKEIKDDASTSIQVNKNFYLMLKNSLFFLFTQYGPNEESRDESLDKILKGKYEDMNEFEKAFFTIAMLLGEIEKNFVAEKKVDEKEVPVPGDPDFVAPTED